MSQDITTAPTQQKNRLYFIDIARSIAILLMLEGHFVHDTLALDLRDESNMVYHYWKFVRGFTSPVFLTVTGIVFTYLLLGNDQTAFWKNLRVRKGLKRVVELLFWGYAIQLSFYTIGKDIYYESEWHLDWLYAFHVLQSIGIGIFFLLVLFGLKKIIKVCFF